MRYAVVYKNEERSNELKDYILKTFEGTYNENNPEYVFTIGGDGTVLDAVNKYVNIIENVKLVTIHTGNLGFYTEFIPSEIDELLESIENKEIVNYYLLNCNIDGENYYALNEVTITDGHRLFKSDLFVDKNYLMHVKGNGVCISTPTGSTAYNRSVGGAVISPSLKAFQIALIAPFESASNKMLTPLVLDGEKTVLVKPENKYVDITIDRKWISKENVNNIEIKLANKRVKFLKNEENNFSNRLNEKFVGK